MTPLQQSFPPLHGVRIGHASDFEGLTGCTVVLFEKGATAGVDVRGGASGTIELGVLDPMHITPRIHAIVLAGGSAFGLEASCGVRRILETQGIGFEMPGAIVPIVPGAILYDLAIGKPHARPSREMGEAAAVAALNAKASDAVPEGSIGAGTGASIGKANGMACAMKGGIGHAVVPLEGRFAGVSVSALVAVNAFGDILQEGSSKILAGARKSPKSKSFDSTTKKILSGSPLGVPPGGNTTLAVVATNAKLTKVEATKMAQMAQAGILARISPAHTTRDGDLVFGVSVGEQSGVDINALGVAAAQAVAMAVERAIRKAKSLGGVPALSEF